MAVEKPEEVFREIQEWLNDPFNEDFMLKRPLAKLNEFSSGRELKVGEVLEALTSLSHWYASRGIVEVCAGESNRHLCDSFWCDSFYNTLMWFSFWKEKNQRKRSLLHAALGLKRGAQPNPRISFNDQGLLMAKAFSLGLITEGEAIGQNSLTGLKEGCFYGLSVNKMTPFALSLFARWKNIILRDEQFPFAIPEPYDELLQNLHQQPDAIHSAVVKACDFHLSRSKENTDRESFEFADPVYAIYPVEILFFMRVRQLLGLRNAEVDHPLLNSPLGKLPLDSCSMSPSLRLVQKRIQENVMN